MIIDPHAVAAAAALLKPVVRELGIGSRTEPAQLDLNAVSETA